MDQFPKLSQIFEGNGRLARFIPQPEASLSVIQVMSSLTSLEAQTQMASMESCCLRNLVLPKRCVYSFVLSNLMPLRIGGMMCRKGCFYEQVFWTMCAKSEEPGHSRTQQECPWPSRALLGTVLTACSPQGATTRAMSPSRGCGGMTRCRAWRGCGCPSTGWSATTPWCPAPGRRQVHLGRKQGKLWVLPIPLPLLLWASIVWLSPEPVKPSAERNLTKEMNRKVVPSC